MCLFIAGQFDAAVARLMKCVFRVKGVILFRVIRTILCFIKRFRSTNVVASETDRLASYNFELYRKDLAIIRDMLLDDIELFQSVPQYLDCISAFYEEEDEWTQRFWEK
ncbi:hypothetical protein niasHT_021890 [Heterodera trifolii]|uniref:Uncharacterized protein n=1 Tax=Heterodera trifolii TaxID=157864 RepID=A0ABD2K9E7_9BILA